MRKNLNALAVGLLIVGILTNPLDGMAFKPKTHVWVGQQVLNDVVPDGKVTINRREYIVSQDIVDALRQFPNEYRMGNVGPDAFPDIMVGQMTAHPGIPGGWKADNWIAWMLRAGRNNPRMRAFSNGYLGHAAGDFFAHTYVNIYAGDIFVLTDGEQTNEKRHFAIESFIAKFTPPLVDHNGQRLGDPESIMSVPHNELRDVLIQNDTVQGQYLKPDSLAAHLAYMKSFRDVVSKAAEFSKGLPLKYHQQISLLDALKVQAANKAEEYVGPIAQAKYNITAAQAVLAKYQAELDAQQVIIDKMSGAIAAAEGGLRHAENALLELPDLERDLRNRLADAQNQLRLAPTHVIKNVCRERSYRRVRCLLAPPLCLITEVVCSNERVISEGWTALSNLTLNLTKQINDARADAQKFRIQKLVELQRIQTFEGLKAEAEARRAAIKALSDADEKGQKELDRWKAALENLESERQRFVDRVVQARIDISTLTASLTINVNPLQAALVAWVEWIDRATEEYMKMSGRVAIELTKDHGNPVMPIKDWFSCWGAVFLFPLPPVVCEFKSVLETVFEKINGIRADIRRALGIFAWLVDPIGKFEDLIKAELKPVAEEVGIKLAGVLLGKETEFLLEVIVKEVDDSNLNGLFSRDESNKGFLLIPDIAARIRADMHVSEGYFTLDLASRNTPQFNAVYNAVTLAKMSLLGPDELNRLVRDNGGRGPDAFYLINDFNVMEGAVRSIDGNHQWNEFAPPYLRRENMRDTRTRDKRTYGYRDGFRLWSTEHLREKVFPAVFTGPIAPAMETPEVFNFTRLIPNDYPYQPTVGKPFPEIHDYDQKSFFVRLMRIFN